MGTKLYQEAIAEARQLREMAEQNAKNKIIDAVTPKIRALIERELLNEEEDDSEEDAESETPDSPESEEGAEVAAGGDSDAVDLDSLAPTTPESGKNSTVNISPGAGVDVNVTADGTVKIDTGTVDLTLGGGELPIDDDILLSQPMAEALTNLLRNDQKVPTKLKKLEQLEKNVQKFSRVFESLSSKNLSASQQKKLSSVYTQLLREAFSLYNDVVIIEGDSSRFGLRGRAQSILKEIKQMASNKKELFSVLNLFEAEEKKADKKADKKAEKKVEKEEKDLKEVDAELMLEPADEEEAEELEALLGDLDLELSIGEPGVESANDMGGEEGEEGEEGMEEAYMSEAGEDKTDDAAGDDKEEDMKNEGDVVEIDESMLRDELKRMRSLRESEKMDTSVLDDFGGGEAEGDMFVDVDEDDLLNALADELGDAPMPKVGSTTTESSSHLRTSSKDFRVNESRKNRALTQQLAEYKKAVGSLRAQLTEMNLFNAKLLYANKLMQNKNVTPKQQRAIVEALDNAKTLREAKLLYQSLTASLNKTTTTGGSLTESRALRGGSSSKSTRPAGVTSGVEVDRWAVLAGLNGGDKK